MKNNDQFLLKRLVISLLLIICMVMVMAPLPVSAATDDSKLIAFTFDDGPSNNTPVLLDGLKSRDAAVTFFMCGVNGGHGVVRHGDLVDRMIREGHQLANHSYNHPSVAALSGPQISSTFARVESLLFEHMGGSYADMVRTPGGVYNPVVKSSVSAPVILWSLDTMDWKTRNADSVYEKIVSKAKDGDIVLMHDLYETSVQGALRAVDTLQEQGYEFVTVAELMRRRGVVPQNGEKYTSVPGQGKTLPAYSAPVIDFHNDYKKKDTIVEMSAPDKGIDLYYTTDGSWPTMASKQYTGAIRISKDTDFTVVGYDTYGTRTPATVQTVRKYQVALPQAKGKNGKISLSSDTPGAELYYTTDGSKPTRKSKLYSKPFVCRQNTLKVIGYGEKIRTSEVASYAVTDNGMVFQDLDPSEWYFSSVNQVVSEEMMSGTDDQSFEPQGKLTRAMMAQILYNLQGAPDPKESEDRQDSSVEAEDGEFEEASGAVHFSDVREKDWFADAVYWSASQGIVNGYSARKFGPENHILREQLVTMLYRYTEQNGELKADDFADLSDYSDSDSVEKYAKEAFSWAVANELVTGYKDGTLKPQAYATRAETAAILERYSEKYGHLGILDRLKHLLKR